MIKLTKIVFLFILSFFIFQSGSTSSLAAETTASLTPSTLNLQDAFKTRDGNICADNDTLDCVSNRAGFEVNKITAGGQNDTIEPIIQNIINIIFSLLGIIFVGFILYAGWCWFSARGNEEKLSRAKNTMNEAVIGLLIVLGSYAISYFVLSIFIPYIK